MKLLLILLFQFMAAATSLAQSVGGCGLPCLSKQDQLTVAQTRETMDLFVKDGQRYIPALRTVTISDGDTIYRNTSRYFVRYADDLTDLRRKAESVHLRRAIGRYSSAFTEFAELLDAGATLVVAKRENNYALIGGAAKTVFSQDAKALLAPVGSLIELQLRAEQFLRLLPSKSKFLQDEMSQARMELWEKTGVDIVPN
jgi:uncharacterized membrane protein